MTQQSFSASLHKASPPNWLRGSLSASKWVASGVFPLGNSTLTFPPASYLIWTLCKPRFPGAGEPFAMDAEDSTGVRRAKRPRGDDPSRHYTGRRTRAGVDRHGMVKKLDHPMSPLPKAPYLWWWKPRPEATRWRWCRVYHQSKHAPDGATFRGYGPLARLDHHHPANPPEVDASGRKILYVGDNHAPAYP